MKGVLRFLTLLSVCLLLAACRPEGVDGPVSYTFSRIVSFVGNDEAGRAMLEFVPQGGGDAVRLSATSGLDTGDRELPVRMLIRYTNDTNEADASGPVTLLYAAAVTQGEVILEWSDRIDRQLPAPVYLYSVAPAGDYIDLRIGLQYTKVKRTFGLAVVPGTLDAEVPVLCLVNNFDKEPAPSFDRTYYCSFSLRPLLEARPDLTKVIFRLDNSNLPDDEFELTLAR